MSMSNTRLAGTWDGMSSAVGVRLLMISSMDRVLCRWRACAPKTGPRRKAWQHHRRRVLWGRAGPAREARVLRPFEDIAAVEEVFLASREVPDAVAAFIGVVVAGGLHDPLSVHLVLAPTINPPCRMRRIRQLDRVSADHVHRPVERGDRRLDEAAQRLPAATSRAAIHVLHEEGEPGVDVACVDRLRVAHGQLPDLVQALQTPDPRREHVHRRHASRDRFAGSNGANGSPRQAFCSHAASFSSDRPTPTMSNSPRSNRATSLSRLSLVAEPESMWRGW